MHDAGAADEEREQPSKHERATSHAADIARRGPAGNASFLDADADPRLSPTGLVGHSEGMILHALVVSLAAYAALPAEEGADRAAVFVPSVCSTSDVDTESVYTNDEAPPGGAFWLPVGTGSELTGALVLVDGNGARTTTTVAARTPHTVAVRVPADAAVGAVYVLEAEGQVAATALRVDAATTDAPFAIASIAGGDPVPATCADISCTFDGSAPRTLTFDIGYTGGPGVLDVFVLAPGEVEVDATTPRSVEARLLPAATEGAVHVEASPAVLSSGAIDVRIRVRALDGQTILHDELLALPSAPQATDAEPPPPCNVNPPCADQGCGGTVCASALPFFFAALGVRGLRRRKPISA